MMRIAERLEQLMEEQGLDQSSLARKVGCSPAAINQIVTGRTSRSRLLPDIAAELGVTLEYLQGRSDDRIGAKAVVSPDEQQIIYLSRQLGRDDLALVRQLLLRLTNSGVRETLHDTQRRYRSA